MRSPAQRSTSRRAHKSLLHQDVGAERCLDQQQVCACTFLNRAKSLDLTFASLYSNAKHYKRATATGLMQLIGNSSGAAIGYIFNAQSAPGYQKGLWISVGLTALSMVVTTLHALALKRINRQRAEAVAAGAPNQPEL